MKKIITLNILLLSLTSCFAQALPSFSCEERVYADTAAIRDAVQDKIDNPAKINFLKTQPLTMKDADEMQTINWLYIYADTINNEIKHVVNKENILVRFPSKSHFYNWQTGGVHPYLGEINSDRTRAFHTLTALAISENADCMFCVSFFPEDRYFYKIISYQDKQSREWVFADENFRLYKSISELIGFYFGSPANYIEIYKKRMQYFMKNRGNYIFISHEQKLIK